MQPIRTLALGFAVACLTPLAPAQTPGVINVSVGNGWTILQDSGTFFQQNVGTSGSLSVTATCEAGRGPLAVNRCQADIQGDNTSTVQESTSASATNFAFAQFLFNGPGTGMVTANAVSLAVGQVDVDHGIDMQSLSTMTLTLGYLGGVSFQSISSAEIMPLSGQGGGAGGGGGGGGGGGIEPTLAPNQLVLTQGAPLVGTQVFMPTQVFFYSVSGGTSGSATLEPGESVLANATAFASADIFLM